MTKEEAIKEMIRAYDVLDFSSHMDNRRKEAFNMAKKALEQKPKMGHWIKGTPKYKFNLWGDTVEVANYECSECGRIIRDIDCVGNQALLNQLSDFPYCHCGCRMAESQESEG